jgi:hypothetical protein
LKPHNFSQSSMIKIIPKFKYKTPMAKLTSSKASNTI